MTVARRLIPAGLALLLAVLCGCSEVEEATVDGYQPAKLEAVGGSSFQRVTLTAEGAERTDVRTEKVRRSGTHRVVPYAALMYDGAGQAFVYTSEQPLTFLRSDVDVARIVGDRVLLTAGPPAGSAVVTVGATEIYGTELEIAGSH